MKILMLTVRADLGGGPEHLFQLLANRPEAAQIWIGCPNDAPYHDRYSDLVGSDRIITIPHRRLTYSALFALVRLVRRERIEVVHSHGKGAGLYGRLLRLLVGVPVVHTFHGLHVGEYGAAKRAMYLCLERVLGALTVRAICVSKTEEEAIREHRLVPFRKLRTIVNGVVVPFQGSAPALKAGDTLKILSVSRYDHQKNPELLIDVALALKKQRNFQMIVLGTGNQIDQIRERVVAENLVDQVVLQGGVPSVRPFMANAHIFLSTSRWEGMPLAVLEAMSEGLCPVVTDVAGNQDLISNGRTGLLYTDAKSGADALATLTPEDIARFSRASRDFVQAGFSVEIMARATFDLLAEVAKR